MTTPRTLGLFEAFGIEIEYMITDAATGAVLPVSDQLLRKVAGSWASEVERGPISWSNELVLHVLELKTTRPATDLRELPRLFQEHVAEANRLLAGLGGRLLPTAMHPWMDPHAEARLWPHEHSPIYEAFDRIFGCRGHGWSNLQSMHVNLPFADDEEFGRLHAAIRLVLPLLPALAASSPVLDGRVGTSLDERLEACSTICRRLPSVAGDFIPEPVFRIEDYRTRILERMYEDIAPYDPEGVLREEFLNSRGAIARLERQSIEIRVIDTQECPLADLAIAAAAVGVLRLLVAERWSSLEEQQSWPTEPLARILRATVREGDRAEITDRRYLRTFGLAAGSASAAALWRHAVEEITTAGELDPLFEEPLHQILERGCLARRILASLQGDTTRAALAATWDRLGECLARGELFTP